MAIKVSIVPTPGATDPSGINIKIVSEQPEGASVELVARRALNGDIMIFDHDLVDIVVSPKTKKITTFPKRLVERETYPTQDKFYAFLRKKGVIDPSSIQSGNVFSSMEAQIYESVLEGVDAIQSAIFATSLFLEEEKPDILARQHLQRDLSMHMLEPDEEYSTELGEVPQSDKKGSMDARVRPYGYQYMYSILRESEEE